MRRLIASLLLVLTTSAWSQNVPLSCDGCPMFHAEGAALYWKPSGSETFIGTLTEVINAPNPMQSVINQVLLEPDYNWGFRVGGGYAFCCNRFHIGVEYNQLTDQNTFELTNTSENVFFESGFFPEAQQNLRFRLTRRFRYHSFDVLGAANLNSGRCVQTSLLFGVRYFYFRLSNRSFGETLSGEQIERNVIGTQRVKLTGPIFGVSGTYCPCSWLQLYGSALFGGLLGPNRAHAERVTRRFPEELPPSVEIVNAFQRQDFFSPLLEARVGGSFLYRFCSCLLKFSVGYEYRSHINGRRIGLAAPNTPEARRELTLSGLVIEGMIAY